MRSLQFSGDAILKNNIRLFNCSAVAIDNPRVFAEILYVLLSGTGVGFSVQSHHVNQLPKLRHPKEETRFLINDSIMGWAQAVEMLFNAYFFGGVRPLFDYSLIRPKGSYMVTTGAKAPGPVPLKFMLELAESKLQLAVGRKLTPLECHDIVCIISDAVLAGGIRRCLPENSLVHTKRGLIRIQEVIVGEEVLTTKGYNKILAKLDQGVQKTINIHTQNGVLECTPNHRVAVLTSIRGDYKWVQAKNLKERDRLYFTNNAIDGQDTDLPQNDFFVSPSATTLQRITIPKLDEGIAWLIGIIHGDGYVRVFNDKGKGKRHGRVQIACSNGYPEIKKKAVEQLRRFGVRVYIKPGDGDLENVMCNSVELASYLSKIKTPKNEIEVPDFINRAKSSIRAAYIAGLMDADGCENGAIIASQIYLKYLQEVQNLLSSLGIASRLSLARKASGKWNPLYKLSVCSKKQLTILKRMIGDFGHKCEFAIPEDKQQRSYSFPNEIMNKAKLITRRSSNINTSIELIEKNIGPQDFTPIKVVGITEGRDVKTWDIEVEDQHEFFTNGYLVHNSSLISLFDKDDKAMLTCKHGEWWNHAPWRARANNSAVLLRSENDKESFNNIFQMCRDSNAGEPGVFFTNSLELLTNPCSEISLNSSQMCNLTTINQTGITNKRDFMNRIYAASLIGTLQASYTDFDYLSPRWKEITDKEALLGVSFTGIADSSGIVTPEMLEEGARFAVEVNEKYASKIGINPAYRITCLKPEGSVSCVLSSSSGIHARHAEYYIRRIRMNADDALALYLKSIVPDLVETDLFSSTGVVVSLPQESPKNAIIRENESALDLFNRTMTYHDHWINPGHKSGLNRHNVSVTISLKDEEWDVLREEMWKNRHRYTGISLLPFDGGNYQQSPFEEINKSQYEDMIKLVKDVDLSKVVENEDYTERAELVACVGGVCSIE
jgi:intein/homing endonuclease